MAEPLLHDSLAFLMLHFNKQNMINKKQDHAEQESESEEDAENYFY